MSSTDDAILVIRVHFHDRRYHGLEEWPPAPARIFQALVAGAGQGLGLVDSHAHALSWLESIEPPIIAAPTARRGQRYKNFVPHNDLDAKDGRPERLPEIRGPKIIHPRLLEGDLPLLYAWSIPPSQDAEVHVKGIQAVATELYQLGRGVDMAWAQSEVVTVNQLETQLIPYGDSVWHPWHGGRGASLLAVPRLGSLARLRERHECTRNRLRPTEVGRKVVELFVQPPMTLFAQVPYGSELRQVLFELRNPGDSSRFAVSPLTTTGQLVLSVRDRVLDRLHAAFPEAEASLSEFIVGRRPGGPATQFTRSRLRLIPLPSVGHTETDPGIRRLLVEIPRPAPVAFDDVIWAFEGLSLGAEGSAQLIEARDHKMLGHYGGNSHDVELEWHTVTPAVLPQAFARRRLDPNRNGNEGKGAAERIQEEAGALRAVSQALRHAGVRVRPLIIEVQREPFHRKGQRAENFAQGTRFAKERFWHVRIRFGGPPGMPLLIGDGRYLGLGLMAPRRRESFATTCVNTNTSISLKKYESLAFKIVGGLKSNPSAEIISKAFRRATLARCQEQMGARVPLPMALSGHQLDGQPADNHRHPFYVFDPLDLRLVVFLPTAGKSLRVLREALRGLTTLRAGSAGVLQLRPAHLDQLSDPYLATTRAWESVTPYTVNRHARAADAHAALISDFMECCAQDRLPMPSNVEVLRVVTKSKRGLSGFLRLRFDCGVSGPLLLGRTRHNGGGVFRGIPTHFGITNHNK